MSKKISYMIADFLVQKNVVQKEKIEIYQYGYEALFFCIEETAMLIAIGFFLHSWIQTLVFIIVFVSLRQYTGGYHAKSRVGCKMVTGLNLALNILCVKIISQLSGIKNIFFGIMIILYVTICVKFILAMVTYDNCLPKNREKECRKLAILSIVYLIIAVLISQRNPKIAWSIVVTMAEVALLIVIKPKKEGE